MCKVQHSITSIQWGGVANKIHPPSGNVNVVTVIFLSSLLRTHNSSCSHGKLWSLRHDQWQCIVQPVQLRVWLVLPPYAFSIMLNFYYVSHSYHIMNVKTHGHFLCHSLFCCVFFVLFFHKSFFVNGVAILVGYWFVVVVVDCVYKQISCYLVTTQCKCFFVCLFLFC